MEAALGIGAKLIGINSRDLTRFVTDLGVVDRLAAMVPADAGITLVAESGLKTVEDVARVSHAGAHAVLVGETFMRARGHRRRRQGTARHGMTLVKVCGITSWEDAQAAVDAGRTCWGSCATRTARA